MKKNVASQSIGAQLVSSTDGSNFTSTASVFVTIDNGTQSAGGGTVTHEGNGYHSYTPTQGETNGDHIAFTFTGTGAISATVQVYTNFPQSQDHTTPIGNIDTVVDLIKVDTTAILDDTSTSGVVVATNNDKTGYSISGTKTTLDSLNDVAATDIVSSGAITTLSGAVVNVDTVDTCTSNTDMRGTDNSLLASSYTAPDNAGIAANGVAIAGLNNISVNDVWTATTRELTSGNNISLSKGTGITGFNDLSFADIWTGTLTESYATNGSAMTPAQAMHMIWSDLRSPEQVSTTWTDYRLDNVTAAMTFTLDDATTPTKKTRSS